jgi:Na+-driven multidrug efflux pump
MALASRYKFSKVLPVVALNVIYARALTFENFWQACPVTTVVIIFNFYIYILNFWQACPLTTVVTEYAMAMGFWFYACRLKRLHSETWGGWDKDEITWSRIKEFLALSAPAAASMASDWWRVTVIGVFAARMGPVQISVCMYSVCM